MATPGPNSSDLTALKRLRGWVKALCHATHLYIILPPLNGTAAGLLACLTLTLLFSLSGTWLWPKPNPLFDDEYHMVRLAFLEPFVALFPALTWSIAILVAVMGTLRGRGLKLYPAFIYWLPLLMTGFISAVLSADRYFAVTTWLEWAALLFSASAAGGALPSSLLRRSLVGYALAASLASIVVVIAVPRLGEFALTHWNGLYTQKQFLGWDSCIFFTLALLFMKFDVALYCCVAMIAAAACALFAPSVISILLIVLITALYGILHPVLRRVEAPRYVFTLLTAGALLGLSYAFYAVPSEAVQAVGRTESTEIRLAIWARYLQFIKGHFVFGLGPGMFSGSELNAIAQGSLPLHFMASSPHNFHLTVLGEFGALGWVCFLAPLLWIALVIPLIRSDRMALAASATALILLVGGLVEPSDATFPSPYMFGLVLCVLLLASSSQRRRSHSRTKRPGVGPGVPARVHS